MAKYSTYGMDCERLFVRDGRSMDEIHQATGLSRTTLNHWKKKYKWDVKRKIYQESPDASLFTLGRILTRKVEQINLLPIEMIDGKVTDQLSKIAKSLERLGKDTGIRSQSINVFARFGPFCKKKEEDKEEDEWLTKMMQAFFEDVREE